MADTVILPLLCPVQGCVTVVLIVIGVGWTTVVVPVAVQPTGEVTVTEYGPASRLLIVRVVPPLLQR